MSYQEYACPSTGEFCDRWSTVQNNHDSLLRLQERIEKHGRAVAVSARLTGLSAQIDPVKHDIAEEITAFEEKLTRDPDCSGGCTLDGDAVNTIIQERGTKGRIAQVLALGGGGATLALASNRFKISIKDKD